MTEKIAETNFYVKRRAQLFFRGRVREDMVYRRHPRGGDRDGYPGNRPKKETDRNDKAGYHFLKTQPVEPIPKPG